MGHRNGESVLLTLTKNCWPGVLDSVIIQLYTGECTPSVDRAAYFQNVMHYSAYRALSIECDV